MNCCRGNYKGYKHLPEKEHQLLRKYVTDEAPGPKIESNAQHCGLHFPPINTLVIFTTLHGHRWACCYTTGEDNSLFVTHFQFTHSCRSDRRSFFDCMKDCLTHRPAGRLQLLEYLLTDVAGEVRNASAGRLIVHCVCLIQEDLWL